MDTIKQPISAIVLTKNEEENIEKCLKSLQWCDEILVIDDNSTDKTTKLAQKYHAHVILHALGGDFSRQHTFGLEQAKYEWVLFVDADEVVTPELAKEIQGKVADTKVKGFFIHRIDHMWGKDLKYGDLKDVYILRLAKKSAGTWTGKVHETWNIRGETERLSEKLIHYPHQTMTEFLSHINQYSTLRAQELKSQEVKSNYFSIILYSKAKFLKLYVLKLGFLDGTAGAAHAFLMAFYSFLVRSKLWLLWQKK